MPRGRPKAIGPEIVDYRHKGAKRKNNPEDGLATYLPEERARIQYKYSPHLDPQLEWAGKAERESFEVPVVPLHLHERVTPKAIANLLLRKTNHQLRLFDEEGYPLEKRIDFYHHEIDWANRFILGDSLLIENSLLTLELMGGKVQMIYIDPPYGIEYNSNFQPTISSRRVVTGKDESMTREVEQIKAYRDTWKLGVHSYLTYLRDRLYLCHELLADSGSIFVQISDVNLHHVRELMDEIFGPKNFCAVIVYRTSAPLGTKGLASTTDFVIWYAKDITQRKYHDLFTKREVGEGTVYTSVELADGSRRKMTSAEKEDPALIPKESRIFCTENLVSSGYTPTCIFPFEYRGKTYNPTSGKSWKTNLVGMKKLASVRRLDDSGETIRYVLYLSDYPVMKLTTLWTDMKGETEKQYVVQTAAKVIQRCMLMTTDPGDLVFDPTCGSGSTAFVAEQFGRRWITCDTSRVAIAIAKARLMTETYPYFSLAIPEEGVRSGFIYETVPHVTLKSIAQEEEPLTETLFDKPETDKSVVRVSGPFTVEGTQPPANEPEANLVPEQHAGSNEYIQILVEAIRTAGLIFPGGKRMQIQNLAVIPSADFLHAEGIGSAGPAQKVAISFGPRYGAIGVRQTETAIRTATANGYSMLILAGFSFDPGALAFVEKTRLKLEAQFAHINPDMEIHDLLKQTQGSQLFSVLGEPDIDVTRDSRGKSVVSLRGVDIYDPSTGKTEQSNAGDLAAWFLDEDYDGYSFNVSQAFFPNGATKTDPWDKLENALRGSIDKEKMESFRGTTSVPFDAGPHAAIAVKVIDERGNEMIRVRKLSDKR